MSDADDFERVLIASAKRERMPLEKKAALALALGAGAATLTAAGGGAAAATTKAKSAFGMSAIAKWILGIAVGSAAVLGGRQLLLPSLETQSAVTRSRSVAAATATTPLLVETAGNTTAVSDLPEAPPPVSAIAPKPRPPASPSASAIPPEAPSKAARPSLTDELRAIDRARTALATGNTTEASRALDAYSAEFPNGVLSDEAQVLEVDLLVKRGDRSGARAAAQSFLATHPDSPHASRLRELLGVTP